MRKHYKHCIRELLNPEFYMKYNGMVTAVRMLLVLDPYSIRNTEAVYDFMYALEYFLKSNQIDTEFCFSDCSILIEHLTEKEVSDWIDMLKQSSEYKINLLFLNALKEAQGAITCSIKKEEFFDKKIGFSNLILDENGHPILDFENPKINILEYAYFFMGLYFYDFFPIPKEESGYVTMLENDDVAGFMGFLFEHNLELKDYENRECRAIVLDVIGSGSPQLNELIEKMQINPFVDEKDNHMVFSRALLSGNFNLFQKYYRLNPRGFEFEYLLNDILSLDPKTFQKVYRLRPFDDVDFIMAIPDVPLVINENLDFLIDQDGFDLNRMTRSINMMWIILENGSLDLIRHALLRGGDLFLKSDRFDRHNRLIYQNSVYSHVFLNPYPECINFVLSKVPKETISLDISPTIMMLDIGRIDMLKSYIEKGIQPKELIRRHGQYLLYLTVDEGQFDGFKFLVDTFFGPNAFCYRGVPLLYSVIDHKDDSMLDYLLQSDALVIERNKMVKRATDKAIDSNYIYGVKRFIEVGAIRQEKSFCKDPLTLPVRKKKQPEIYAMLSALIPKWYYWKWLLETALVWFLIGTFVSVAVMIFL